ncbi:MAG: MoaD/ThiS family protein [Candidatus Helarchaeota archaeon]
MKILLIFESILKNILGKEQINISGDYSTINDVVNFIYDYCKKIGKIDQLKTSIGDKRDFYDKIVIILNDIEISALDGKETTLNDEDQIVFIPITHGG